MFVTYDFQFFAIHLMCVNCDQGIVRPETNPDNTDED